MLLLLVVPATAIHFHSACRASSHNTAAAQRYDQMGAAAPHSRFNDATGARWLVMEALYNSSKALCYASGVLFVVLGLFFLTFLVFRDRSPTLLLSSCAVIGRGCSFIVGGERFVRLLKN